MTEWATQEQVDYMKTVMLANDLFTGHYDRLWKLLEVHETDVRTPGDGTRMTYETADKTITWLNRQVSKPATVVRPAQPQPQPRRQLTSPDVAEGYYATPSRTGNNDYDFWRVDRPASGRWAGRTFVKRVIGGHSDTPVRGREMWDAFRTIDVMGQDASAKKYADEIGNCSRCNRHLTDELSRSRGKGPECWSRQHAA